MAYCDLFFQLGLEPTHESVEWRREIGDYLINLESSDENDDEWWLTVVCSKEAPRFEFAGNLGACVMQYAAVVLSIQAGVFRGASGVHETNEEVEP